MAGEGDAQSSAEMAVKHVSWSKVSGVTAHANTLPTLPDWRPVACSAGGDGERRSPEHPPLTDLMADPQGAAYRIDWSLSLEG